MYEKKMLYSWEEIDIDVKKRLVEIAKIYKASPLPFNYLEVKVRYDGKMKTYLSDQVYHDSFTVVASQTEDDPRNTSFLIQRIQPGLKYEEKENEKSA